MGRRREVISEESNNSESAQSDESGESSDISSREQRRRERHEKRRDMREAKIEARREAKEAKREARREAKAKREANRDKKPEPRKESRNKSPRSKKTKESRRESKKSRKEMKTTDTQQETKSRTGAEPRELEKLVETEQTRKSRRNSNRQSLHTKPTKLQFDLGPTIDQALDLPVLVQVNHSGFWLTNDNGIHYATQDEKCDRNSVMLSKDCLLYIYKLALRHLLLSMKAIIPDDIDSANLVPHIRVRKDSTDPFSKHNAIQNKKYIITEEQVSIKKDFMILEIDSKKDLHCTLIYCKKLGERVDLMDCFKKVLKVLNTYPELIDKYFRLEYFGSNCHDFWYDDSESNYPFNVEAPPAYIPKKPSNPQDNVKVSAAGSIICEI